MADTGSGDLAFRKSQGSRRARQDARRPFRVHFSLSAEEMAALEDAASRAGMAKGAFAARVVLTHVRGDADGPEAPGRELLRELGLGRLELLEDRLLDLQAGLTLQGQGLPAPCVHEQAVPVPAIGGNVVAWLCPQCDTQLPQDFSTLEAAR